MELDKLLMAADVGGTKTLMGLFHIMDGKPEVIMTKKYASRDFDSLGSILQVFLKDCKCTGTPLAAAFGIPGPVENGFVKSTNLPWVLDEKILRKKTGIAKVRLINDLAATAYSLPQLAPNELVTIKEGKHVENPERHVILAPGTGLGQSFLIVKNGQKIVIPSEGGHTGFAPSTEIECDLLRFLMKKFSHVSFERLISGIGLPNIFDFLVEEKKEKPQSETLEQMKTIDRGRVISEMAMEEKDNVCVKALDIFISILGTHAGNLALTFLPDGGIYLAGGIPYKILPKLKEHNFLDNFLDKGRMSEILEHIPIKLITNNQAALKGASLVAYDLSQE